MFPKYDDPCLYHLPQLVVWRQKMAAGVRSVSLMILLHSIHTANKDKIRPETRFESGRCKFAKVPPF